MQHGLAVEADDIDIMRGQAVFGQEPRHRIGVALGDLGFERRKIAGALRSFGDGLGGFERDGDPLRKGGIIGRKIGRPGLHAVAPVGLDQRQIDAVHRGAAHQAERRLDLAHAKLHEDG